MKSLANLDLLSVGIMVVVTCVLGFTVYFNNRKSITNKLFLALTLDIALYVIINYFSYQFSDVVIATFFIRLVLFIATIQGVLLCELFLVFPNEKYIFSNKNKFIFIPVGIFVSLLTLTPHIFYSVSSPEILNNQITGSLWLLFVLFSAGSILSAIFILLNKIYISTQENRRALVIMFLGLIITYAFILNFNLILPIVFHYPRYIVLGPLFIFPFIICTAYAILKHKLFNLKVTETILFSIGLLIIIFIGVVYSDNIAEIIFRGGIFVLILVFTIIFLRLIIREINRRKEIQSLNIRLKELGELKSGIVSLSRHHIASPLTALKGYVSLFREGEYGEISQDKKQALASMDKITDNLISVVRDFIDVSRLDDDKIQYKLSDCNFKKTLEDVLEKYKSAINQKNINLIYNCEPNENYIIQADQEKLFQAVSNIIENSLKYTREGKINVNLSSSNKKILLIVSDTGIRILPSTPSKLLEKFSHSGNKEEADIITNNLGLYFTKQIIKIHGGDFRIEVKKDSLGSRFFVGLPVNMK